MTKRIITISHSELDAFRQCPAKHQLAYNERWVKHKTEGALARGTLWHQVMEEHYTLLQRWQQGSMTELGFTEGNLVETMDQRVGEILEIAESTGTSQTEIDTVSWMYDGYVEHYGLDPEWEILAVEHPISIPLFDPKTGRKSQFRVKAKIDLVVRHKKTGKVWLWDHKSCRDLPKQKDLDMDDQFGLYHALMKRVGHRVFGSIHSAARTYKLKTKESPLDDRFARAMVARTDAELLAIERETLATAKSMHSAHNQHERHVNPDTCSWRCDFTEACLLGRKVNDDTRTRLFLSDTGWTVDPSRH